MRRKRKVFRPFKNYRYLEGLEAKATCISDLRQYNSHRYRVFTVVPTIDDHPLKMDPRDYYKVSKLGEDALRLQQIDKENKNLLKRINYINRNGGLVDCFNPNACKRVDKWAAYYKNMKLMEKANKQVYSLIISASSYYKTSDMNRDWNRNFETIKRSCKLPYGALEPISADESLRACPSISHGLERGQATRPICYLEFEERSGKPVGRIIIELYYDHVPVTVQNFLEICCGRKLTYRNCLVHRIVKGKFLETGDITKGNGRGGFSIYGKTFHEENHMLSHTRPGILSMKRIGMSKNNSQFCITFTKMEQLDHKNVVFGKVVRGNDTLFKIEGYGRKIGKPYVDIIISNTGILFSPDNCDGEE